MSVTAAVEARRVRVHGRVQGVSFRYCACQQARIEGLQGWVQNEADGSVTAWLQGETPALMRMLQWLRHGPAQARVDRLESESCQPEPALQGFEIRR
ncbi:acylphosphatase [Marinobacterium rhizophilum]|uniref:Acylphosphatase n=1 Tax=Marinobacterium rhizophilum TaxID=420402 RepID=A0ABY5HLT2_9GAMM|nr:acylphosphatase [Marinobacterium rhizophilum]UTW13333.1 acylphosphatase [Marinobacterium rhizophilum]